MTLPTENHSNPSLTPISVAHGDGIGPEIMQATIAVLKAANAPLMYEEVKLGLSVYEQGNTSGIDASAWDSIRKTGVLLKAPITTPQGGGVKSLNVTLRKTLGLFANVRPTQSFSPYVPTHFPKINLVIVRENEEDTYAGIEHQQTDEVTQCLKLITRPGSEKLIRYAFEYARAQGRKKLTCMSKDNIMKLTDGLFHRIFDEVAKEYPEITTEHMIIDIGAARLAARPEQFDVIVAPNLYGDILSDIAAEVAGSVGLAGSANFGQTASLFEAIHGSAPDIAGKDVANPSALIRAANMMLAHLGYYAIAETIENALLKTIEDGIHTPDIFSERSTAKVGTQAFAQAVIERLGQRPQQLPVQQFKDSAAIPQVESAASAGARQQTKQLEGVDVFLHWNGDNRDPSVLGKALEKAVSGPVFLKMISNRGGKVYPDGLKETYCTDHWRCRFLARQDKPIDSVDAISLQMMLQKSGFDIIKTENLYSFDGKRAYSLGQGE